MKRPSSGLGVGLRVVGGLVGLYLLGYLLTLADGIFGWHYFRQFPGPIISALKTIYSPLHEAIGAILYP